MIQAAWSSVAVFAIASMQDLLNLDNQARMNYPGNPSGNWGWRMGMNDLSQDLMLRLKDVNYLNSRTAGQGDQESG